MDSTDLRAAIEALNDDEKAEIVADILGVVWTTFTVALSNGDNPQIKTGFDYHGCGLERIRSTLVAEEKVKFRPSKRDLTTNELRDLYDNKIILAIESGKKPKTAAEEAAAIKAILLRGGYSPEDAGRLMAGDSAELGSALTSVLTSNRRVL